MSTTNHKEVFQDVCCFVVEQATSDDLKFSFYYTIPQETEETSFIIFV